MTDVAWYLLSAGGAIVGISIAALAVCVRPQSRAARRLLVSVATFYWLASTWGLSHLALAAVGRGFEPLQAGDVPEGRTAIVILGSGSFTARDWADGTLSIVDRWAAGRVLEAVRVFHFVHPAWVISSGGLASPDAVHQPPAVTMRSALLDLGIPAERVRFEVRPRNTATEAAAVSEHLRELSIEHTILVTSQFHMRRAVGTFRAHGITVIPAAARPPDPPRDWVTRWLPSDLGLYESALAAHEILGLGYYIVRGWYSFR